MNNNNGPSEVQVLREMLINDQKPTRTMLTKEGQPNKQVAAEGKNFLVELFSERSELKRS
jgi:hypothetical protein